VRTRYAIVNHVEATCEPGDESCRFTARIDPSPEAALGAVLTVFGQTSGHTGLVEEDPCTAS
jgi:hypothetical protein